MTKAAIIPFFRYEPVYQDNYKVLFKFFQRHFFKWGEFVDKAYIIDSGCNFTPQDILPYDTANKLEIIKKPAQSHWQNMNEVVREVPEPLLLLLDSDTIIYDRNVVKTYFDALETLDDDVWTIFDTSGGVRLAERFPIMAENKNRGERRRFCPYLCFLRKSILRSNFDFTPIGGEQWMDSMGSITQEILEDHCNVQELQDDRSTISLEDDGRITSCQWLDSSPKKWALEENPDLGYYHIRNFGGGLKILNEGTFGLVPGREARRLLAWVYILGEKTKTFIPAISQRLFTGGQVGKWAEYYEDFKNYHSWIKDI